ncbi:hypothetical protein PSP6_380011 [Paraburkholderia tropica]|nr:hypothetical protein PSP6_380011 [Paraburkholderia tropica]
MRIVARSTARRRSIAELLSRYVDTRSSMRHAWQDTLMLPAPAGQAGCGRTLRVMSTAWRSA